MRLPSGNDALEIPGRRPSIRWSVFAAATAAVSLGGWAGPRRLVLTCNSFPPAASAASLQRSFGSPDVDTTSVPLGDTEGDMLPATVLFPHDPMRRIEIVWKDRNALQYPRYVWLNRAPTAWRTSQGITIGTSLRELERLNRGPFHLAGFAFDESGAVTSWDGGRLMALAGSTCDVRVWLDSLGDSNAADSKWYKQVVGDRDFSSRDPAMQALNPRVSRLQIVYH